MRVSLGCGRDREPTPPDFGAASAAHAAPLTRTEKKGRRTRPFLARFARVYSTVSPSTETVMCIANLALLTGSIGVPGAGVNPLRGQNNVQGASDAGLIPMVYPDYQSVEKPQIRNLFEEFWHATLDPKRGLTVVEIMTAIHADKIKAMYIMG